MKKWTDKSRRMMQKVINDYKAILRKRKLETYIEAVSFRECPFCNEVDGNNFMGGCRGCRIVKYFDKECFEAFPVWNKYDQSILILGSLKKTKAKLRLAIKELEPWGLK